MDVVEGHLVWEQGKKCTAADECVVCNDITECPHCFIGASRIQYSLARTRLISVSRGGSRVMRVDGVLLQ